MRRQFTLAVLATSLISVLACGGDTATRPLADVTGTWKLTTVNGTALPFTIQAASPKIEVTGEALIITGHATFQRLRFLRTTTGSDASESWASDEGIVDSYVIGGRLQASDGSAQFAERDGSTLVIRDAGNAFVYLKQ
jgi:hypothetical protein